MSVSITVLDKTTTRIRLQIVCDSGYYATSVMRTDPFGTWTVRAEAGMFPTAQNATVVVADYEYPLLYQAPITYTVYAERFSAPLLSYASATVTIDAAHPAFNTQRGLVHLTVPRAPASGVVLNESEGAHGGVIVRWEDARQTRHTMHTVVGRADPVVVLQRATTRAGTMEVSCPDLATATQVEAALAEPQVFLLRQSDQYPLGLYFVPIGLGMTHTEQSWKPDGPDGRTERRWTLTVGFQEVGWPSGYVVPPSVWTFADVAALYGDFNAVASSFATFADLTYRVPK